MIILYMHCVTRFQDYLDPTETKAGTGWDAPSGAGRVVGIGSIVNRSRFTPSRSWMFVTVSVVCFAAFARDPRRAAYIEGRLQTCHMESLFPCVKTINKTTFIQFFDKPVIDEVFRFSAFCGGYFFGDGVEHGPEPGQAGILFMGIHLFSH
jgi:hypothetical protein